MDESKPPILDDLLSDTTTIKDNDMNEIIDTQLPPQPFDLSDQDEKDYGINDSNTTTTTNPLNSNNDNTEEAVVMETGPTSFDLLDLNNNDNVNFMNEENMTSGSDNNNKTNDLLHDFTMTNTTNHFENTTNNYETTDPFLSNQTKNDENILTPSQNDNDNDDLIQITEKVETVSNIPNQPDTPLGDYETFSGINNDDNISRHDSLDKDIDNTVSIIENDGVDILLEDQLVTSTPVLGDNTGIPKDEIVHSNEMDNRHISEEKADVSDSIGLLDSITIPDITTAADPIATTTTTTENLTSIDINAPESENEKGAAFEKDESNINDMNHYETTASSYPEIGILTPDQDSSLATENIDTENEIVQSAVIEDTLTAIDSKDVRDENDTSSNPTDLFTTENELDYSATDDLNDMTKEMNLTESENGKEITTCDNNGSNIDDLNNVEPAASSHSEKRNSEVISDGDSTPVNDNCKTDKEEISLVPAPSNDLINNIDQVTSDKSPTTSSTAATSSTSPSATSTITPTTKTIENVEDPSSSITESSPTNEEIIKSQSLLIQELQTSLQSQMTLRGELDYELKVVKSQLAKYSTIEDELESKEVALLKVVTEKTHLEQEVSILRKARDDFEHKETLLQSRLNEAKKKEANKTNAASRLELEKDEIKSELQLVKEELSTMTQTKEKIEKSLDKFKKKCVERVKMSEAALTEERNLNEERKEKMKKFVEAKADELRSAKIANDELRTELKETAEALKSVRDKLEYVSKAYEDARSRNRELLKDMNRMKKDSEQLHQLGDNLELELHKSAQETEEHKNKRLTAKHELMTMLRKLEAEQAVTTKLRESIKYTYTPKALSQQQLLTESLQDFETELSRLSRRLGKPVPLSKDEEDHGHEGDTSNIDLSNENLNDADDRESAKPSSSRVNTRSEWDTTRLLSNLDGETQAVSKGIMAISNAIERLHMMLDESGDRTCVSVFNDLMSAVTSMNSNRGSTNNNSTRTVNSLDGEEDDFAGVSTPRRGANKLSSEQYGLVPR